MSSILGISAFYHDSAACLLKDGEIVAAVQEERFTRKKHDQNFPSNAIQYCLDEASIKSSEKSKGWEVVYLILLILSSLLISNINVESFLPP